ncbi:MgtC/SapB family protein [Caldimonas caldifontis]|uniref:Protein MgtC n=1 Tax=Caldimonas caldifontis TaxID=1452508 RepID=A0A2S5SYI4_9BURK|nr:MgtC/SapB family protein [Caldimonas caldifontis]PPE67688.1 magnesium transporter MgtC [Caldimonas caldifontis]
MQEWLALVPVVYREISIHLLGAVMAGGLIGLERSYHGRPAGFRTHTLVCLASSLLMLITVYHAQWFAGPGATRAQIDPTRMAQGIMTGIGFLGAGVIFKEGLSVRGLTTAASIWITAAIGILIGVGFFFAASLATVLTLGVLALFRLIEGRLPTRQHAHFFVRFARDEVMPEGRLRALLDEHGFSIANLNYRLEAEGTAFEYRMVVRTQEGDGLGRLATTLTGMPSVREFRISPAGD